MATKTKTQRTWQTNADEARATEAGTGWIIAILVACSVRKAQGKRPTSSIEEGSPFASITAFADRAGLAVNRINSILATWPDVVAAGLVPPMDEELTPDQVSSIPLPTVPFAQFYTKHTPNNDQYRLENAVRNATPEQVVAAMKPAVLTELVREVAKVAPTAVVEPVAKLMKSNDDIADAVYRADVPTISRARERSIQDSAMNIELMGMVNGRGPSEISAMVSPDRELTDFDRMGAQSNKLVEAERLIEKAVVALTEAKGFLAFDDTAEGRIRKWALSILAVLDE